jgi:hypothetical protein
MTNGKKQKEKARGNNEHGIIYAAREIKMTRLLFLSSPCLCVLLPLEGGAFTFLLDEKSTAVEI